MFSSGRRLDVLAIVLVTMTALAVRIPRLWWGYPFLLNTDESQMFAIVLDMMRHSDPNPHHFYYGHGLFYLMQLWLAPAVALMDHLRGVDHVPLVNTYTLGIATIDTPALVPYGRAACAAMGTALAAVVFVTARCMVCRSAALACGLFVATSPLLVQESAWVLTNVPMTFFLSLVALFAVLARKHDKRRSLEKSAAFVGIAASFKYPGGMALTIPLAHSLAKDKESILSHLRLVFRSVLFFVVVSPFIVFDPYHFFRGLGGQFFLRYSSAQAYPFSRANVLLSHLIRDESAVLLPLMLYGIWLTWRRRDRFPFRCLSLGCVVFLLVIFSNTHPFYRDLAPLIVIGVLVAAFALHWITLHHPVIGHVLVVLLVLQPLMLSIRMNVRDHTTKPAPIAVSNWVERNVEPGARLWADGYSMTPPGREDVIVYYSRRLGEVSEEDLVWMENADYLVLASIREERLQQRNSEEAEQLLSNLQTCQLIASVRGRSIYKRMDR